MAKEALTAGVWIGYAVEATAGTRPTSGYTKLPSVTDIGDLDDDPETKEVTDLSDQKRRFIPGLKGGNGIMTVTANKTEDFMAAWKNLQTAHDTAASSSKATWFAVVFPTAADAYYFAGDPVDLGLSGVAVDEVLTITGKVIVNDDVGYATKPTT